MKLPSTGIRWTDYKIDTPTFQLSPIEKPDASPFLIHMTGRNSLESILNGKGADKEITIPEKHGFIKSSIPDFEGSGHYSSRVVCFTESPVFALDFFRYRSFRRWNEDQQFGIGFSKEALIKHHHVRPVVYLDTQTNKEVLSLCSNAERADFKFSSVDKDDIKIKTMLRKLRPLLFPMLEDNGSQGFMWEREWRYPYEDGLIFSHNDIKVICCPANERKGILAVLDDLGSKIEIVESWREYDEVTSYLKRRERLNTNSLEESVLKIGDLDTLVEYKEKNDQTLHALSAHYEIFKGTTNKLEGQNIAEILESLRKNSEILNQRIEEIRQEQKNKKSG